VAIIAAAAMGQCAAGASGATMCAMPPGSLSKFFRHLIAATALVVAASPALAEGQFYGLMRERDLTPFGFMRLDMRPAHAVSTEPGSWAVETDVAFQNTWALSPEVEKYLVGLEPTGRRKLGPEEVQAIRDLPGENYLVDLEAAVYDVTVHYKLAPNWSAYAVLSGVSFRGGFMDDTIEKFHDTFGFSTFGRPALARNRVNTIFDLKGTEYVSVDTRPSGGLLDPVMGLRYSSPQRLRGWNFSLEGAVKMPVAGQRDFLSTGRVDYGVQASAQRRGARQAFYVDLAAVWYGGGQSPAPRVRQLVPTLVLGYELRLTDHTNVNLQGYMSPSLYSRHETDLRELRANKYQATLGLRHRVDHHVWTIGITENLQNINNTPDIGFQVGFAWVPRIARPRPVW
jgi:hypothetical protein